MTGKHGCKPLYSEYRLTLKQMSSEPVNTSYRGLGLGADLLHNNSMETSAGPLRGWLASHLSLFTY